MSDYWSELDIRLDLATIVARLEQVEEEGYADGHWLLDRVITCDLPRLKHHLTVMGTGGATCRNAALLADP